MNPHGLLRLDLNQVRLPISPLPHINQLQGSTRQQEAWGATWPVEPRNRAALVICRQMSVTHRHLERAMTEKFAHGAKIDTSHN